MLKSNSGTLTLSGNNTYTGTTTVSGGILALGSANALAGSTLDTGTPGAQSVSFTLPGNNTYNINGLTGSDDLNIGANTISLGEIGATASYSGVLSGTGNLIKRGAGSQTLASANSFSGSVAVQQGGTLSVPSVSPSGNQPLGTGTGNISLADSSTLAITGAGTYSLPSTRGLSLSGAGGILDVPAGTVNISGGITGNSNLAAFTKTGAGTLNYTGSASWNGNFNITGGTVNLSGGSIAGAGPTSLSNSGTTLRINTTGEMKTSSLSIASATTVNLEAGVLRVGGGGLGITGRSITNNGTFTWGNGTLAVYTAGSGEAGLTDRTGPGGDSSGPEVREGNYLSVQGDLTNSAGSTLDLGPLYLSNGLRYNQFNVSGTLSLNGGTLNIGLNPYFLRPSSPNSVASGDWGTLILVYAGDITGAFAASGGKTTIPGISSDGIGWTQLADNSITNPATMPLNTWAIEYRDGVGGFTQAGGDVILLHYKVAGSVPEPASAALILLGGLALRARALRRKI